MKDFMKVTIFLNEIGRINFSLQSIFMFLILTFLVGFQKFFGAEV